MTSNNNYKVSLTKFFYCWITSMKLWHNEVFSLFSSGWRGRREGCVGDCELKNIFFRFSIFMIFSVLFELWSIFHWKATKKVINKRRKISQYIAPNILRIIIRKFSVDTCVIFISYVSNCCGKYFIFELSV